MPPTPPPRLLWTRITRKLLKLPLTATDADGQPVTIEAVGIALLPQRSGPDADTVFAEADVVPVPGDPDSKVVAAVLAAAPDADQGGGAVAVPEGGADVYARVNDVPEVDAELVGHIDLLR